MERFTFSIFGPREKISPASKFIVSILALQYQHMCAGSTEKNKCSCFCLPFSVYSIRGQTPSIVLTVFTRTEWIECPDTNLSTTASKGGIFSCHGAFSENVITVIQNLSRARNRSAEGTFFCFSTQIFLRERKKP